MRKLLGLVFGAISFTLSAQDTTRLSLVFAGDIMGHDSQIASAYDAQSKSYNYTSCFAAVKPYIDSADLAIANLEVTLAGTPYKGYPQFSSPDALAVGCKEMGFDVLVTSNNHCADRGKKGLERTLVMLDSFQIAHTGTFYDDASRLNDYPLLVQKNGFRLALLNYTYGTNGMPVYKPNIVNMLDTAVIRKDLIKAKSMNVDAIIVVTHWGSEYQSLPAKREKDLTEFCFKHGAKLVIGAHPHVIQPMEWRKEQDQFVAYSLGNFVSGQRKRYTDGGALAHIILQKITQPDSTSVTNIHDAAYQLVWVYRTVDIHKDYYLLPSAVVETPAESPIKDATSRAAATLFLQDSRSLLGKHNLNVGEKLLAD